MPTIPIRTAVCASMSGYLSGSVQMPSFLPSFAALRFTLSRMYLIGSLSLGSAVAISLSKGDLKGASSGRVIGWKVDAILLNAGSRTASSCGVH